MTIYLFLIEWADQLGNLNMANSIYKNNPLFLKNKRLSLKQLEQRVLFDGELAKNLVDASVQTLDLTQQEGTILAEFVSLVDNVSVAPTDGEKVVFIDSSVIDKEAFINAASNYSNVIVLDSSRNAWEQISEEISTLSNVSEIHLISHGSKDGIILNHKVYNSENLNEYASYLETIKSHTQEGGDFLIYGCNIGSNSNVEQFASQINTLTGLDVALSTNDTGGTANSDFNFEYNYGNITTQAIVPISYNYVLTNTADGFGDTDYNGDGTADPLRMITWNVIGLENLL